MSCLHPLSTIVILSATSVTVLIGLTRTCEYHPEFSTYFLFCPEHFEAKLREQIGNKVYRRNSQWRPKGLGQTWSLCRYVTFVKGYGYGPLKVDRETQLFPKFDTATGDFQINR